MLELIKQKAYHVPNINDQAINIKIENEQNDDSPFITEPIIPEQKSRNISIKRYATQAKSNTHLSKTPAIMRAESLDPKT